MGPSLNTSATNPDAPVTDPDHSSTDPLIILSPVASLCGERKGRKEKWKEWNPERESKERQRWWDKPRSSAAGQPGCLGGKKITEQDREGFQEVERVQVSSRVEGSQHTGVAEIVSSKASFVSQLFLDSHELVVLSQTLRTAWGTSLDLACAQPHHQVCDEGVLSLA